MTRALSEFRGNLSKEVSDRYRADSLGIPRITDPQLVNGAAGTLTGYGVGIPGQDPPSPRGSWQPHLGPAQRVAQLPPHHGRVDPAGRPLPLLRKAVNYYLHFLEPGTRTGSCTCPPPSPPRRRQRSRDCRRRPTPPTWGCRTLLESAQRLGLDDESAPRWREVLAKTVGVPRTDANGFMIGADIPFAKSHRHYSHLLAVYPLYELTGRTPDERALIQKSLAHWVGFEGALQGYTFTGAASMSALLGKGEDALRDLGQQPHDPLDPAQHHVQESGPVIETPLSAAQSLHDMVCQSWGGVVRVFPALPAEWADLTVHDFRTQGAFLLSAVRKGGATRWVRLVSEAGAPCVVRHGIGGAIDVRDGRTAAAVRDGGRGDDPATLRRGESALITAKGDRPDLTVTLVRPGSRGRSPVGAARLEKERVKVDVVGQRPHPRVVEVEVVAGVVGGGRNPRAVGLGPAADGGVEVHDRVEEIGVADEGVRPSAGSPHGAPYRRCTRRTG